MKKLIFYVSKVFIYEFSLGFVILDIFELRFFDILGLVFKIRLESLVNILGTYDWELREPNCKVSEETLIKFLLSLIVAVADWMRDIVIFKYCFHIIVIYLKRLESLSFILIFDLFFLNERLISSSKREWYWI